jgi:FkbM family methyltransferase
MLTMQSKKPAVQTGEIASLVYNGLLRSSYLGERKRLGPLWRKAWRYACGRFHESVETRIHGYKVAVNFGHSYALYARRFRQWNNPLIELVHQSYRLAKAPITVIDVGAGIGVTVLLIESICPSMVDRYICVEGDEQFCSYLQENLAGIENARVFEAMISDAPRPIPTLVRTHPGTASAKGNTTIDSITLDALVTRDRLNRSSVLKIDVDGFDGKVLLGAQKILATSRPAVIFEWHPILCKDLGNSWLDHFQALHAQGYQRFIWFTKYGHFSHFMHGIDQVAIERLAEVCIHGRHDFDWHYDVVALTDEHGITDTELAELSFAKSRRSRY